MIYSIILSSAQRLPNGNTLICSTSQGFFIEVTLEKETVWEYSNYMFGITSSVPRVLRYSSDYPGVPEALVISQMDC